MGKQVVDQMRGHTVHPFPYRVGGHVRPRGRRQGGAGKGPADLIQKQGKAIPEQEQDGVKKPGWFAGDKVIEGGLVEFRQSGGGRELREAERRTADG